MSDDTGWAQEMMGSGGANHSNIIQYLGILEQRMFQLLQVRLLIVKFIGVACMV